MTLVLGADLEPSAWQLSRRAPRAVPKPVPDVTNLPAAPSDAGKKSGRQIRRVGRKADERGRRNRGAERLWVGNGIGIGFEWITIAVFELCHMAAPIELFL